ncbi:MAG: protein translocase subunit SecD [Gammaproteobacteria bacterium]|nr:MAG: protein translocase subunit SecD [Gammaproteobacteria bacterium]
MNRYPWWKYALILVVIGIGILYALPNLYGEEPAVQIIPTRGASIDEALEQRIQNLLKEKAIAFKGIEREPKRLLIRFSDTETQLKAMDVLREALGDRYVIALHLAPATPGWLLALGARPMHLGLDLRGGVYFLLDVDMEAAIRQAEERYSDDIRSLLRKHKIRYRDIEILDGGIRIRFKDGSTLEKAKNVIAKEFPGLEIQEEPETHEIRAVLSEREKQEIKRFALQQNITTLRNRVNELGVAEPVIQQQGDRRIVVQLPGVQDTARAKEILGATATLEFRLVDMEHDVQEALKGKVPPGSRLYYERNGRPVLLKKRVILTGDYITNATSGVDQRTGSPAVFITLDSRGARIFSQVTKENVGKLMAVVYIETKTETRIVDGKPVKVRKKTEEVISVARILQPLGKRFQITGLDSMDEAHTLALLLRAGALAAPMDIVEERTVGPSLGKDNIERGFESVVMGFLLVLAFMVLRYKVFGLFADVALALNLVLIVAVMSMLQATLTMPGIAGIVLTVGMAVDANVLIFERIREELQSGNTPLASINAGYSKAMATIADANITTLIAAIVLFSFGTGPVKGFAVTLSIGILTSMFTAIMVTRAIVNLIYGGKRRLKSLPI